MSKRKLVSLVSVKSSASLNDLDYDLGLKPRPAAPVIKFDPAPVFVPKKPSGFMVERLISGKKIGPLERSAADEILLYYTKKTGAVGFRSMCFERNDRSYAGEADAAMAIGADVERRGADWFNIWSAKAKRDGDPMLQVIIKGVALGWTGENIELDHGMRKHGTAQKYLQAGLRDYAARAGWVSKLSERALWMKEAADLYESVRRREDKALTDWGLIKTMVGR